MNRHASGGEERQGAMTPSSEGDREEGTPRRDDAKLALRAKTRATDR